MNAEIFVLPHHRELAAPVQRLLEAHGFHPLVREIGPDAGAAEMLEVGRRYIQLLQASIPPQRQIGVELKGLEMFGYRLYIEVYHAFRAYRRSFQGRGLDHLFPAVAVDERMVLVPRGAGAALALAQEAASAFDPFEAGGVLELDFGEEAALVAALERIEATLRRDLLADLRAWSSYREGELDLAEASRALQVERGYLQRALAAEAAAREFYATLECTLDCEELAPERWTRVHLTVINRSEVDLAELAVTVSGPVRVRPGRIAVTVPAGGRSAVPIALWPEEPGEYPLEVVFTLPADRSLAPLLPVHHLWLRS